MEFGILLKELSISISDIEINTELVIMENDCILKQQEFLESVKYDISEECYSKNIHRIDMKVLEIKETIRILKEQQNRINKIAKNIERTNGDID